MRSLLANLRRLVLPFGAGSGERMELSGQPVFLAFYDENNDQIVYLDPSQFRIGAPGANQIRIDPFGGVRAWDENDQLRLSLSTNEGLIVRDVASGVSGAQVRSDGIVVTDPTTGDTITILSGGSSVPPPPRWASSTLDTSSATHPTPAVGTFDTGDDIDLRFVAGSRGGSIAGGTSMTPPSGFTELSDVLHVGQVGPVIPSLITSAARLHPAESPTTVENFTCSSADFARRVGQSVVLRGGGGTSPSVADTEAGTPTVHTTKTIVKTIDAPTVSDGDILIAHVSLAGPAIPIGWDTPDGWKQAGVQSAGIGTSHVLGSGIWWKRWTTGDPTSETITINMTAAVTTVVQATVIAVTDVYEFPAGLDLRRNNRSMPRGLERRVTVTTTQGTYTGGSNNTAIALSDVEMIAGRSYEFSLSCPHVGIGTAIGRWRIDLDRSGVGRIHTFGVIEKESGAGTKRIPVSGSWIYVPDTDEAEDWTIVARESSGAANFAIEAANDVETELTVVDVGGTF